MVRNFTLMVVPTLSFRRPKELRFALRKVGHAQKTLHLSYLKESLNFLFRQSSRRKV